jgi:ubiquinone/menaquinone biosynthesis C-methylase UbiE/DNA-binding transcriptional ArsR family regulator
MALSLQQSTELCQLLGDPSRLRLLLLLEAFELTMAELTEVTGLAQSRISTHLSRLRRAGLVQDKRTAGAALYFASREGDALPLWELLRSDLDDGQTRLDRERAEECIRARKHGRTWAETVAGRMELHYSPGRTWEATARALIGLTHPGHVLDLASGDGVLAELLAEQAASVTCVDISRTVIDAAERRLSRFKHVRFHQGDMHALPFDADRFDTVFALHALSYTTTPERLLAEAARLLKPGGQLVVAALKAHRHEAAMAAYDHLNLGTTADTLKRQLQAQQLKVAHCRVTSREVRPPYFEVITAQAVKPTRR